MSTPGIYLISGDNSTEIIKKTNELLNTLGCDNADPFAFDLYTVNEETDPGEMLQQVVRSIKTPGFFGNKTICLRGFNFFDEEPNANGNPTSLLGKMFVELIHTIEETQFDSTTLILSGEGIDSRKSLYKLCHKKGQATLLKKLQLTDRNWSREMGNYISDEANKKGLKLSYDIIEYLVNSIGTNAGLVEGELEKIWCYNCGGPVSLEDVHHICHGEGESATWIFVNALCDRDAATCYQILHVLLHSANSSNQTIIGIILSSANAFLQLLKIHNLLKTNKLTPNSFKNWLESLSADQKEFYNQQGFAEIMRLHPFRAMKLAEQAIRFSEHELINAIIYLRDCNLSSIHENINHQTLLEEIILRISIAGHK